LHLYYYFSHGIKQKWVDILVEIQKYLVDHGHAIERGEGRKRKRKKKDTCRKKIEMGV
tara:strand:+ start:152 stop:325 length:174 start_codon:yes stop_codon:yes gene_type:complete